MVDGTENKLDQISCDNVLYPPFALTLITRASFIVLRPIAGSIKNCDYLDFLTLFQMQTGYNVLSPEIFYEGDY